MCTNYETGTPSDIARAFDVQFDLDLDYPLDIFRDYRAPIVRRPQVDNGLKREAVMAGFRLIPSLVRDPAQFKASTMNARTESVDSLFSFKGAWRKRQLCVIPAWSFFEPFYETAESRSVRWRIADRHGEMLAIGGIWDTWSRDDHNSITSFSMLTINCDSHPLLRRFHKWFDEHGHPEEKRTPVLIPHDSIDQWLSSDPVEAKRFFTTFAEEDLLAEPYPLRKKASPVNEPTPDLF